jgi:hypothetical protein
MSLSVPPVGDILSVIAPYRGVYSPAGIYPQALPSMDGKTAEGQGDSYKVRYDPIRQELVLEQDKPCPIRRGDWIVLITTAINGKITSPHRPRQPSVSSRFLRVSYSIVPSIVEDFSDIFR